jgi:MFS family permease
MLESYHAFAMLVALSWFQADASTKAVISSAPNIGLLLTPIGVALIARSAIPAAIGTAVIAGLSAVTLVLAAYAPILSVFTFAVVAEYIVGGATLALMAQIYSDNFPNAKRGRIVSIFQSIRIGAGIVSAQIVGSYLTEDIEHYRIVFVAYAVALLLSGVCLLGVPSQSIVSTATHNPFAGLRFLREDGLLRIGIISWMLFGMGNLMTTPLRVEYLANPAHGLHKSPEIVVLLLTTIPGSARLLVAPLWGTLFDKLTLTTVRNLANAGVCAYMLVFFSSKELPGLCVGAALYGVFIAGCDVAWVLWTTRIAPPGRVADYMSTHTFFSGVRGVFTPMIAFHLLGFYPMQTIAIAAVGLVVASSLVLLPRFLPEAVISPEASRR